MPGEARCHVSDCNSVARSRGLCSLHYQRERRTGDPLGVKGRGDRFITAALGAASDDCIEWPFARQTHGYGLIWGDGATRRVSRIVCEARHGAPPTPLSIVLHSCDNPPCINPRHLRWGTHAENTAEAIARGRR